MLMDSLCFSHDFNGIHLVIWKMKEFVVEESWTQFFNLSHLSLVPNYYERIVPYYFPNHFVPLSFCEWQYTRIGMGRK